MHLSSMRIQGFKRFTDLRVDGLSPTARLIVLSGPNGSGKSSFFDALKVWHWYNGAASGSYDSSYHEKIGGAALHGGWTSTSVIQMHEDVANLSVEAKKKLIYVRSAHRNEADFSLQGLSQMPSPLDQPRVQRSIDNDASVSINYQRLVLETLSTVYDETQSESMTRADIRDRFIGRVREALATIFPDLTLLGVSPDPLTGGTFRFSKGASSDFPYKNLSAGEKAAFDLLLDLAMSGRFYDDTIWCVDEPETHLNVRVQAKLLEQMLSLLPPGCQLVLASHSLGFMRRAWELARTDSSDVQFLDFQDHDFDRVVSMRPTPASRQFWVKTLDVAMGDLAALVAPEIVVLCEGRPVSGKGRTTRSEFDARCYRAIFADDFPNADFISLGNSDDVKNDKLELGRSIQAIASGTRVLRLTDRDLLNDDEVADQKAAGVQVLGRRNIEAYLLDDEVLSAFASSMSKPESASTLIAQRNNLMARGVERGHDSDDFKSIAGEWYTFARKTLELTGAGSTWEAFAVKYLATNLLPGSTTYLELRGSVFPPI